MSHGEKRRRHYRDPNGVQRPTSAKRPRLVVPVKDTATLLLILLPELRPKVYGHMTLQTLGRLAQTCSGIHKEIVEPGTGPAWLPASWAAHIVDTQNELHYETVWQNAWYSSVHSQLTCRELVRDFMHEVLRPAGFFSEIPMLAEAISWHTPRRTTPDTATMDMWVPGKQTPAAEMIITWRATSTGIVETRTGPVLVLTWTMQPIVPETLAALLAAAKTRGVARQVKALAALQKRGEALMPIKLQAAAAKASELEARTAARNHLERMISRLWRGSEDEHMAQVEALPGLYKTMHEARRAAERLYMRNRRASTMPTAAGAPEMSLPPHPPPPLPDVALFVSMPLKSPNPFDDDAPVPAMPWTPREFFL